MYSSRPLVENLVPTGTCQTPLDDLYCSYLFCFDMLQRAWLVQEVVRVCLWHESSLLWLLHVVLVSLLVRECDSILLRLELQLRALHSIC